MSSEGPPFSPKKQETVQMMSREDIVVKPPEEREEVTHLGWNNLTTSEGGTENPNNLNGSQLLPIENDEDGEVQDEDQIDELLSPILGEMSMLEQQEVFHKDINVLNSVNNQSRVDGTPNVYTKQQSPNHDIPETVLTPVISDDKRDYITSMASEDQAHPHHTTSSSKIPLFDSSSPSPISTTPQTSLPVSRFPIPNRRPKGWISSLKHPRAVSTLSNKAIHLDPPRSSSTSDVPHSTSDPINTDLEQPKRISHPIGRVSSIRVDQQAINGRRVSGAMQYAFQEHPLNNSGEHQNEGNSGDLENPVEIDTTELTAGGEGHEAVVNDEEIESMEALSPSEEARIRYEVGLSQDQDEIWMEYVRNQLSTLFPDFFGANPEELGNFTSEQEEAGLGEENVEYEEERSNEGSVIIHSTPSFEIDNLPDFSRLSSERYHRVESPSIRRDNSAQIDLFSISNDRSFATSSTDISSLATPPLRSNAEMLRGNVVLPNVRDEISGLREEIERLRSVVGDLAFELGQQPQPQQEIVVQQDGYNSLVGDGNEEDSAGAQEVLEAEEGNQELQNDIVEDVEERDITEQRMNENSTPLTNFTPIPQEISVTAEGDMVETVELSESYMKTAHTSANIIRTLHRAMHGDDVKGVKMNKIPLSSDAEVFDAANLEKIKDWVEKKMRI